METLCRVCSSPGNYDIYGKIPAFLNTDHRRDLWKQPISKMVMDVTGIPIAKNDGLPERICGLCISYLKHAVTFRNRAVQTRLSLLSATFVTTKSPLEDFGMTCDKEEETVSSSAETRRLPLQPKEDNSRLASTPPQSSQKVKRFFDYEEKKFVEDDVMKMDETASRGIEINHPEVFRERKCGFCPKRFMLEDTYDEHLDDCIFRTLIEFIKDSNYFVQLKEDVAISNHEFIRRMIFAIQRVSKGIRGMNLPPTAGLEDARPRELQTTVAAMPANVISNLTTPFVYPLRTKPPPPPVMMMMPVNMTQQRNFCSPTATTPYTPPNRPKNNHNCHDSNNYVRNNLARRCYQTPSPASSTSDDSARRRVVCRYCDKTFLTITHLDGHIIKEHT